MVEEASASTTAAPSTKGLLWESVLRKSIRGGDPERVVAAIGLAESGGAGHEVLNEARGQLLELLEAELGAKLGKIDEALAAAKHGSFAEDANVPFHEEDRLKYEASLRQHESDISSAVEHVEEAVAAARCQSLFSEACTLAQGLHRAYAMLATLAKVRESDDSQRVQHRQSRAEPLEASSIDVIIEQPGTEQPVRNRSQKRADADDACDDAHLSIAVTPADECGINLSTIIGVGMAAGEMGTGVPITGPLASLRRGSPARRHQSPDPNKMQNGRRQSPGRISPMMVGRSLVPGNDILEAGLATKKSGASFPSKAEQSKDCSIQ